MEQQITEGSCLCGGVRYRISGDVALFQYCHCSRCRKFTGSAFAANLLVQPDQLEWITGEAQVGRYELPGAKHFATCFCKQCGSSLPWPTQSGKAVIVPAGSLDGDPGGRPIQNIYCASRAVWYVDPADLPDHEEMPPRRR